MIEEYPDIIKPKPITYKQILQTTIDGDIIYHVWEREEDWSDPNNRKDYKKLIIKKYDNGYEEKYIIDGNINVKVRVKPVNGKLRFHYVPGDILFDLHELVEVMEVDGGNTLSPSSYYTLDPNGRSTNNRR